MEDIADEQTVLSHDVTALFEHPEQMRTSYENLQDQTQKLEHKFDGIEN